MAPETAIDDETRARIVELLAQAQAAHQAYESVRLKKEDPNRLSWYAGFMLERGLQRIWPNLKEAQLASLLGRIDQDYQNAGAADPWPEFAAARLLQSV